MATRARLKTKPNAVRDAQRRLRDVNVTIGRHMTGCYRCSRTGAWPAKTCDTGWELAKAQARAQAAVHRAELAELAKPVQRTLW